MVSNLALQLYWLRLRDEGSLNVNSSDRLQRPVNRRSVWRVERQFHQSIIVRRCFGEKYDFSGAFIPEVLDKGEGGRKLCECVRLHIY